jgi:serine/threonine protein kinase
MKIVKNARNDDYQRAKREIDILKTINSQYIVEYFDSYFATDEFYIVMKFYGVFFKILSKKVINNFILIIHLIIIRMVLYVK